MKSIKQIIKDFDQIFERANKLLQDLNNNKFMFETILSEKIF